MISSRLRAELFTFHSVNGYWPVPSVMTLRFVPCDTPFTVSELLKNGKLVGMPELLCCVCQLVFGMYRIAVGTPDVRATCSVDAFDAFAPTDHGLGFGPPLLVARVS